MKNRPHKGAGFVGDGNRTDRQIIPFPASRTRPPWTLSQHIAHYAAQRCPRGAYTTPLPGDFIGGGSEQ